MLLYIVNTVSRLKRLCIMPNNFLLAADNIFPNISQYYSRCITLYQKISLM